MDRASSGISWKRYTHLPPGSGFRDAGMQGCRLMLPRSALRVLRTGVEVCSLGMIVVDSGSGVGVWGAGCKVGEHATAQIWVFVVSGWLWGVRVLCVRV